MLKAAEFVLIRRNGDHPFRILGLYGAGRNIEVSCVQSKHNPSTTSLAHINSTTCYNVQVRGKYLRLIIVWSGFPDNNLFFFSLLFVPLCISWPRFFVTSNEVLLYPRYCTLHERNGWSEWLFQTLQRAQQNRAMVWLNQRKTTKINHEWTLSMLQ